MSRTLSAIAAPVEQRLADYDWAQLESDLDAHGWAHLPRLLTQVECSAIAGLYDDASRFRSRIVMARHGFGRGEYQYFGYPLPDPIAGLRGELYGRLGRSREPVARGDVDRRALSRHSCRIHCPLS